MLVAYRDAGGFLEFMVNLMRGDAESHADVWMRLGFRLDLVYLSLSEVALYGVS